MSSFSAADIPHRFALLPIGVATRYLTHGVLAGLECPPPIALGSSAVPIADPSSRWDTIPVRELLEEAMARFATRRTEADAWLAPRLHATLRMTRREASNKELWAFLALQVAPDYVTWRHQPSGRRRADAEPGMTRSVRFVGAHDLQAFARLWWAAELFRDGADYRSAEIACRNQEVFNTVLRLDVIDHRPVALAMVRVLEHLVTTNAPDPGVQVNALCKAVNVAGATLMYEVIAPDATSDDKALFTWVEEADSAPTVSWERLPDGPDDGAVPPRSVDTLTRLYHDLLAGAALRDRTSNKSEETGA